MKNIENKINVNHTPAAMPTMFEDYPEIMRVEDVQKALGIGRITVYRLIQNKKLNCVRFGKIIRVPKISLIEFVLGGNEN